METFEITSADRYRSDYGRLGDALGVAGVAPAPGELEFLRLVLPPGRLNSGMLPGPDIFFAAAVTSILRPRVAIEIGTASGSSAAIIAKMIALRQAEAGTVTSEPLVHTIDNKANYVFDATRSVGFAIELMTPELRDRIVVHAPQDSSHCRQLFAAGELTFAFIDGNHRHPWPLVDVMQVQQVMEHGWILMHDVDLPGHIERAVAAGQQVDHAPVYGAKHVFDLWPHEKIRAGNIGVIRIPAGRSWLGNFVEKLRALPAEVSQGSWRKRWRLIDSMVNARRRRRWFFRPT
jgi:predicted O-methyltransferase YrrM